MCSQMKLTAQRASLLVYGGKRSMQHNCCVWNCIIKKFEYDHYNQIFMILEFEIDHINDEVINK